LKLGYYQRLHVGKSLTNDNQSRVRTLAFGLQINKKIYFSSEKMTDIRHVDNLWVRNFILIVIPQLIILKVLKAFFALLCHVNELQCHVIPEGLMIRF
jgi:hypothetical protein